MIFRNKFWLALTCALLIGSSAALADRGGEHGRGHDEDRGNHGNRHEQRNDDYRDGGRDEYRNERRDDGYRSERRSDFRFDDHHRSAINEYYGPRFQSGRCPPGLLKHGNGCTPPGQERRWGMGQPLPRGVAYYSLPRDVLYRLPPPPNGHRYVRVGADILLITIGSSIVINALQDIGGY